MINRNAFYQVEKKDEKKPYIYHSCPFVPEPLRLLAKERPSHERGGAYAGPRVHPGIRLYGHGPFNEQRQRRRAGDGRRLCARPFPGSGRRSADGDPGSARGDPGAHPRTYTCTYPGAHSRTYTCAYPGAHSGSKGIRGEEPHQ